MQSLNAEYWRNRYQQAQTGWDIGAISTPIKNYMDQLTDFNLRILVPGAGNAYELQYLWERGFPFSNLLDWADEPIEAFHKRVPAFPRAQLHTQDFFEHQGEYDLIIEQTFFCAIDPSLRLRYVEKMRQLLKPGGKLVGVLFQIPLNSDNPPFGGDAQLYRSLFEPFFQIRVMETCYNSIPARRGNELFIHLVKPFHPTK